LDKHKVAEKLGISNETGRKLLKSLVRAGYLREDSKKKPIQLHVAAGRAQTAGKFGKY
jgi:DNA-binding IclR family transcriptional regulator